MPREFELGNLSGDVSRSNIVGDFDTADTYQFSLGDFEGVNITLNGLLNGDADIRLIRDFNNNRIVDANEEIARSTKGGITPDIISNINQSGDYFLQVNQFSGRTGYTLTLTTSPPHLLNTGKWYLKALHSNAFKITALPAAMRYILNSESFDRSGSGEKLYCIIAGSAVCKCCKRYRTLPELCRLHF